MIYIYFLLVMALLLFYVFYAFSKPKNALFVGLVFTTFTQDALPWHFIPINGVAFGLQLFFISAAILIMISNAEKIKVNVLLNSYMFLILLLFIVILVYSYVLGCSNYGLLKSILFLVKIILPLFAFAAYAPFTERHLKLMFITIIIGSLFMAISLLFLGDLNVGRVITNSEQNPITTARVIGLGATLILILMLKKVSVNVRSIAIMVLFIVQMSAMLFTGSRGPLMAIVFAILATFIYIESGSKNKIKILAKIIFMLLVLMLIISIISFDQFSGTKRLISYFTTLGSNSSDRQRIERFKIAINGFKSSMGLGAGTGGFSVLYGVDRPEYPHNLVLEILVEQGLIGLLILTMLVLITLNRIKKLSFYHKTNVYVKGILSLWFFTLFNAMVSGDIITNYPFWIIGGVFWYIIGASKISGKAES